ncbi:alpha/beta hydrolase family protein [Salibacterium qingdaonense]|uniref:Alpha/beta hydrolase family protein n=1 Tax=Salibacterium qingdaonense TaxID=266892 RepID=A0A1I4KH84_9BACI|nr:alpha/beta fold hydrolase [Salibacterium qingdaonense]SFL77983.1 Alpha/beta hydrolase family protein [Salibacterium qingdaonense]
MTSTEQQSFTIDLGNNLFVRGDVHTPAEQTKRPVVIICHGFKGHKDWNFFPYTADKLAASGYYAIRFNFSCNGVDKEDFDELDKFAVNTYTRELKDLKALLQAAKDGDLPYSDMFDTDRTGIVGHSRGGATSIIFAAEHTEVKAVVTWNGVADVDFLGEELKQEIREKGAGYIANKRTNQDMAIKANLLEDIEANRERFDILSIISGMDTPLHIIQGDADGSWLQEGAEKMRDAASEHSLTIIEGGTHTFNAAHPMEHVPRELEQAIVKTTDVLDDYLR